MRTTFLALSAFLIACETTKIEPNPPPADASAPTPTAADPKTTKGATTDPTGLTAELAMVDAPGDIKESLTVTGMPGGARLVRNGKALCPLATNGVTVRAAKTGPHLASVFIEMRDKPGYTECRATANVTVRGLEPGKWRLFVLGMGGRLDGEVDVPPP